ncbi:DNA methyltransferase [Verrucosispora sp. WMMD573]|uniref:Eco57I restriction-modification methylase domain-containing protein n=1 Tax=Verrucosispora sp. WMMD573 TaxID=3015149 RepID=UPI00248C0E4D|nr:DNA methyltransferase [Verrucosispora sp. WMMD573]WBB52372.1 N-6 DNA methylase [Verrucosispora sp. WMMD573]
MDVGTVSSEGLRNTMVDHLVADHEAKGLVMRPEVEAALRTVPRELFTPGVAVEEAYRGDSAVVTKRRGEETVSSVSAPWLIAEMLGQAVDALDGQRVQPVDYRNLGAEELGSVYESLLELDPRVNLDDRAFHLLNVKGNDRKTTGSYYTPPSLVSALLDTTLDPLLQETVADATSPTDAETRLLALTVCDPACGSGHFLVAAARRIARRLAQVRSGDDEPTPAQIQHALRDVIGHCIYGVDLNDLAAELAKVSLWMEALEPGKPLGFLDARIRVGNSLLGATPALLRGPLPDEAFKELTGDDKKTAAAVRKRNKAQVIRHDGYAQDLLFIGGPDPSNAELAAQRAALLELPDDVNLVRDQASRWQSHEQSAKYRARRVHADTWCAAFVWPMPPTGTNTTPEPPTNAIMRAIAGDPLSPTYARFTDYAEQVAAQYRFFHWHVEFPEVFHVDQDTVEGTPQGWSGGFSCVLGNPPWERVKLQEKEFFAARHPEIATAANAATRKRMIAALDDSASAADRALHREWMDALRVSDGISALIRESGRYPLTATGDINTYAIFAEAARSIMGTVGRLGIVVPTGIATDSTTQRFFRDLVERQNLVALHDFENEDKVFPNVHNQYRFALLALSGRRSPRASMAFRVRQAAQILDRAYSITPEEILLLNPNTGTCPVFVSRRDAEITIGIYHRMPVLWRSGDIDDNPWGLSFMAMLHMANDSGHFIIGEKADADGWSRRGNFYRRGGERLLPLYEAKMAHHFDHRFSTYEGATQEQLNKGTLPRLDDRAHADPTHGPLPRYWVPEGLVEDKLAGDEDRGKADWPNDWLLGWRDIARGVDERTLITTAIPRVGVGDKYLLALPQQQPAAALQANLSAFVLDYTARQKASGASFKYFLMKQLPVLPPGTYATEAPWQAGTDLGSWVTARVLELSYTTYDLGGFARDHGDDGPPFVWDRPRRALLRAELDAAYFHLYGVCREDVDYIMDTFKVVRERDEKAHGEYRTKGLILDTYDAMQHAIDSGKPYETVLNPPPGQGLRHPAREEASA